jgi:hypothetical protein
MHVHTNNTAQKVFTKITIDLSLISAANFPERILKCQTQFSLADTENAKLHKEMYLKPFYYHEPFSIKDANSLNLNLILGCIVDM